MVATARPARSFGPGRAAAPLGTAACSSAARACLRAAVITASSMLVAAALPAPGAHGAQGWLRIAAPDGAYSAYLPAPPTPFHDTRWTPIGRMVTVGYELLRGRDGCSLTTTEMPALVRWLGGSDIVYRRSLADFLEENHARSLHTNATLRNGHRGRATEWESGDRRGRAEFFLVGDQFHVFNCFAKDGSPMTLSDTFFERLSLSEAEPDSAQ